MKKLFTLLSVTLFSFAARANGVKIDSIYYVLDTTNYTASVTYAGTSEFDFSNCYAGRVVIPDSIIYFGNKYAVTSVGTYAFYYCSDLISISFPNTMTHINANAFSFCSGLKSVTLPDGMKDIGSDAFACCSGLTSISIPNSVMSIGRAAFSNCSNLTTISIPNSMTNIEDWLFYYCTKLTSITIPSSILTIGEHAFSDCSNLATIDIPNSVTSIGISVFHNCAKLTSVTIPQSITNIGTSLFSNCSSLTSINVSKDNPIYDSRNDCNAIIETSTNTLVCGCKNTSIPNSVTSIGDFAFSNCSDLITIFIPNSVTTIGSYAFYYCSKLATITIPESVISIGEHAFYFCENLTSIDIPMSVVSIGNDAFHMCSKLTAITIPNSLTHIEKHMFSSCSMLTSIVIPSSVTSIEEYAFSSCSKLTSINIPNSVISIGNYTFERCSRLTSITIPNSVTNIGSYVFEYCSGLISITCLTINPPSLGNDVFKGVPRSIPLYVPASSVSAYKAAEGWNEFDIQPLLVDVNPTTLDTTQLSWLPVDSASLYKLRIYSEQIELDTTLLIEADSLNGGISIPVTLAPQHNRRMPMDDIGSVVVITLEPNSGATTETPFRVTVSTTSIDRIDILFDMDVYKGKTIINEESGGFTLNAPIPDGLEDIPMSRFGVLSGIYDLYGHRYSHSQWNAMPAGIYILRDGEKTSKVMKR